MMHGTKLIQFLCGIYRQYVLKLSQADVAKEVKCSRQTVSNFESGKEYNEGKMGDVYDWYIDNGFNEFLTVVKKKLGD